MSFPKARCQQSLVAQTRSQLDRLRQAAGLSLRTAWFTWKTGSLPFPNRMPSTVDFTAEHRQALPACFLHHSVQAADDSNSPRINAFARSLSEATRAAIASQHSPTTSSCSKGLRRSYLQPSAQSLAWGSAQYLLPLIEHFLCRA